MQRLHSRGTTVGIAQLLVGKVTREPIADQRLRGDYIIDSRTPKWGAFCADPYGYSAVLVTDASIPEDLPQHVPIVHSTSQLEYVADGDVIAIQPSGNVNVLYRRNSHHNSILLTERCNSLCLMCSQPPKPDDDSYRVPIILRLLDLINVECPELILSGGEPALLGEDLFDVIDKCERKLPQTAVHVLTNGRLFKDARLARRLARIQHHDLMLGIPLYADCAEVHDYVVQAAGAFEETLHGLYSLAEAGVRVEIRVVVHKQTYERLPQLAEFIYRNIPFASQVVLMGMEMYGLVHQNMDALWIDPIEYQDQLEEATLALARGGIRVMLYNHQLCVLRKSLWPFAVKSISDWKNTYIALCADCVVRERCGGFFQSGV
jgi:His-Xaa-Ser system radical SAM maturase HxsC